MATHSSTLACKMPWTKEPDRLQSMGSDRKESHTTEPLHINTTFNGSVGKESAYIAGDTGSIPGLGRSPGQGNGSSLSYSCGSPGGSGGKEFAMQETRDLIPGSGRTPGEGHGNSLQYSYLENSIDRAV